LDIFTVDDIRARCLARTHLWCKWWRKSFSFRNTFLCVFLW